MNTYKERINEFIDWTSGVNTATGVQTPGVTSDNPISGQSIRNLLQDKLKTPFITYKDDAAGYIRFFSSKDAENLWKQYSDKSSVLYDEEKASDLVLYNMDLPATYRITGMDDLARPRYIIEGNSNSENAIISLILGIEDSLGSTQTDTMTVTYTITDSSNNVTLNESQQIDSSRLGQRVNKNIYLYLRSGDNVVTVKASCNNFSAATSKTFHIYLVTFSISSDFSGYYNSVSYNTPFAFNVMIQRSITSLPVTTTVTIDGHVAQFTDNNHSDAIWRYTGNEVGPTLRLEIYNPYAASDYENNVKHTMVIKSSMGDAESGTSFDSNILVYEFEVASSTGDLTNKFVNVAYSMPSGDYSTDVTTGDVILQAQLYSPFTIDWGYYTDSWSINQQANVQWAIRTGNSGNYSYTVVAETTGNKRIKPEQLRFIPNVAYQYGTDHSYLVARIANEDVTILPITIKGSSIEISEKSNYSLKLSAYGKTNTSDSKDQWVDSVNNISTTFSSGVSFDNITGWDDNALTLRGADAYATINYCPFPSVVDGVSYDIKTSGSAFEIDFQSNYVDSNDDIILTIGNPQFSYIAITPNSAAFYQNSTFPVVKTNFKTGERVKLCFIFNKQSNVSSDSNLVYIVNNGILERAAAMGNATLKDDTGRIKIGGSRSGIKLYSIRAYRQDITPRDALNNYMFDNSSNVQLISRNDIYELGNEITYNGLRGKQDIILIEGNLDEILNNASAKQNATVNIKRESNTDSSKDFEITDCRIRNHGQSTLSYPITSMKIWFNKSNKFVQDAQGQNVELTPVFHCQSQEYLDLSKNRYVMKDGAIPSNKFVLQANYADSSGAHNGSLLRLIQDTWYNARINGEYKLRTAPQLFTSGAKITHTNPNLNEDETNPWVEGIYNIPYGSSGYRAIYADKTWPEITNVPFPYTIRTSSDSFPCTVFYRDTSDTESSAYKLLGQYVFMDDKKSDFVYGERSIYNSDISDPFCMKTINKKADKKANKVWDNENVLQIEVVYPNSPLTSYISKTVADSYELDENDNLIPSGTQHRFDEATSVDDSNKPTSYYWEQHFEMIYPDKEDLVDDYGAFSSDKFVEKATPFMEFLDWITDVAALRNTGSRIGDGFVTQAELDKFKAEAHDHLDLYKLAAYYIFFLRFGLVDSVERNAQLKTYDGKHWHYEPWDMDIALGCANNGVITYEPPIDRKTLRGGSTYAFSGRTSTLSNVLWDCLEAWDYWANTIVPDVAQALYDAGLTYDNASKMFDDEYVNKWSETLYNESGHYKYIDAAKDPKWRLYLNGARVSHRHWWLSTSMNYYDAKWGVGEFSKHSVDIRMNKNNNSTGTNAIRIVPTVNTFFKAVYGQKGQNPETVGAGLTEATRQNPAVIEASRGLDNKTYLYIYGATSIEELDLSSMLNGSSVGAGYTDIGFSNAYDEVLGASIKSLKVGAKCTPDIYTNPNATSYTSNLSIAANQIDGLTTDGHDVLENLQLLDVTGWYSKEGTPVTNWISNLFSGTGYDRKNISKLYAMGCNTATEFKSSDSGNNFEELRLPTSVTTLEFINSSWDDISFWKTTELTSTSAKYDKVNSIPASVNTIRFRGTTAKNECAAKMIKDWISNIEADLASKNPSYTQEDLYNVLSNKRIYAEQINWGAGTTKFYYDDLVKLSKIGSEDTSSSNLKGYIIISDSQLLSSLLLSQLQNMFGSNVFNVGTSNSNLVVDQNLDVVTISVTDATINQSTGSIYVSEKNSARLSANHFRLTSDSADNLIIDSNANSISNLTYNKYVWGVSTENNNTPVGWGGSVRSVYLLRMNDGTMRLMTNQGSYGDYDVYVRVWYKSTSGDVITDSVKISIIGVTYPNDFIFSVTGNATIRKFNHTPEIAKAIFGDNYYYAYNSNNNWPDVYVMYKRDLEYEFALIPSSSDFTAEIDSIQYWLSSLDDTSNSSGWVSKNDLGTGDSSINRIGTDLFLGYTKSATHGGMLVKTTSISSDVRKYRITCNVDIGGRDTMSKSVTIMVIDDENPIVRASSSSQLYSTLSTKYNSDYNQSATGAHLYKTDLLSLTGSLDFSDSNISSLLTANNDSVFLYTPYIKAIIMSNCTSITMINSTTGTVLFDFSNIIDLQYLNFSGCTSMIGEINLTNYPNVTSAVLQGTGLNIRIGTGSKMSGLVLGSPSQIYIEKPKVLSDIQITDNSYIDSVDLIDVNTGDSSVGAVATARGFNIFNKLYGN